LTQAAEVKRQTDMGRAHDFGDSFDDARAGFRPAENCAAVFCHRIVIEMSENPRVGFAVGLKIESRKRKSPPAVPMFDSFGPSLTVARADVGGIHHEDIFVCYRVAALAQRAPVLLDARALNFIGGDPWQCHQMMAAPADHLKTFRIFICGHINRWMRLLHGFGVDGNLGETIVLAGPLEFPAGPRADNDIQRLR
jgi:hypothetical protein